MTVPAQTVAACVVLAVLTLTVAGCRGTTPTHEQGSPIPEPALTEPSGSESASAPDVSEQEAIFAYRGMWDAFVEAGKTSDPDAADLRLYASDDALALIVSALYTSREQRQVTLGDLVIEPAVAASTPPDAPTKVEIRDCVDDSRWLEYEASGGLVDDEPGGRHRTTATVTRSEDGWKVSSFTVEAAGTC